VWSTAGVIGMLIGTIRIFVQAAHPSGEKWEINEKISQVLLIGIGIVILIIIGLFPGLTSNLIAPYIADIPVLW
jgi:heme/copper-type cytochrome/quinol oxidase subunit 2